MCCRRSKKMKTKEVKIDIDDEMPDGFLNTNEIKKILEQQHLYPLAKPMTDINARDIEEIISDAINDALKDLQKVTYSGGDED